MKIFITSLIALSLMAQLPTSISEDHQENFDYLLEIQLPDNFVPEEHYAKNLSYFEQSNGNPPRFNPQFTIEYLIITTETLWDTLNDNFKEWKINNDNKINSILIVNVSSIIADTDCWVTGQYGDATNISEGNPWIENGKEVTSEFYSMFNDTQCKIRNFIRKYVTEYNITYVLLAGNKNLVPPRMICSYAHSGPDGNWYNDTSHASDMYYSCLNHNLNNNTNTRWMENRFGPGVYWATVPEWDEIDWEFDVIVGRVLINTVDEANRWITKTKAYVNSNIETYLQSGMVASKDVYNNIDDYVWTQIGDEFPVNISFINGQNISQEQWNIADDYCNGDIDGWAGIALIHHSGHGGTFWTPYQPSNLNNNNVPNFLLTEGCHSGDFGTDTSSRAEQWMEDDGGIYAGIINSAYGWFIASTWYGEEMFDLMFDSGNELCFAKANNDARENIGWQLHSVAPMIFKELNFFGDPALEFNWYEQLPPQNYAPVFFNENPTNGTMNLNLSFLWTVTVEDLEGDNFDINISCTNGQWTYWSDVSNSTYGLALAGLENNTWYNLIVWANDTNGNEREEWFNFRTKPETYPPWDVNEDGLTDYLDVSSLVSHYGESGDPGWIPEDIVEDGIINYLDVSLLVSHYGESY